MLIETDASDYALTGIISSMTPTAKSTPLPSTPIPSLTPNITTTPTTKSYSQSSKASKSGITTSKDLNTESMLLLTTRT
jgi:hypothetical protein